MAKYTKRPDFSSVHIPGFGMLAGTQVIEGDYDRFVPSLLVKVADSAAPKAKTTDTTTPMEPAKQADLVAATRSDEVEISVEDEPAPKQAPAPAPASKSKAKK